MAEQLAPTLRLTTLGIPALALGGRTVALQPLPLTLLAYLVVEGPQPRRHLAELFWPRSDNALNGLSSTLSRIRTGAPGAIEATKSSVAVSLASDLSTLDEAIANADAAAIVSTYQGTFLRDVSLRTMGSELEEWLLSQRDSVFAKVERSLLGCADDAARQGRLGDAADIVETLFGHAQRGVIATPEFLPRYHRHLAATDHPLVPAIEREADEFGVALTAAPRGAPHVPAIAPIFGFDRERRALQNSVAAQPISQIIGLGGSGKTLLATDYFASAEATARFERRVWVDLSAVTDIGLVEAAIAGALGEPLRPGDDLVDLVDLEAPTLVVIDNFEQVAEAFDSVRALAERFAALRVIITSRIPVLVGGDATVALDGLPTDVEHGPAQQLFRSAAQRVGITIDAEDQAIITAICALVGGLPLAIELAGAWTRVLPPSHIATSLGQSSELLSGPPRSEQRAVAQIIVDSVDLLDDDDQQALRVLAAFPAGLDAADASPTLDVDMRSLARLADRSLVTIDRDAGRLSLHPLIAQHVQNPGADRALLAWCETFVVAQTDDPTARIGTEYPNIAAAWRLGAELGEWKLIDEGLAPVREFVVQTGRLVEGQHLFAQTRLQAETGGASLDLVVRLLEAEGWVAYATGQTARARKLIDHAHNSLASTIVTDETRALIWRLDGTVAVVEGHNGAATAAFERALALTTPSTPPGLTARLAVDLGRCHESAGDLAAARMHYRSALDLGREGDDPQMVALGYFFLASLEQVSNPKRCLVLLDECRQVAEANDLGHLSTYFPILAGHAHLNLSDARSAEQQFRAGLELSNAVGLRLSVAATHVGIAESLLTTDPAAAKAEIEHGIRVSVETRCMPYLAWAAYVVADLLMRQGSTDAALAELLVHARRHPALATAVVDRVDLALARHQVAWSAAASPEPRVVDDIDDIEELGLLLRQMLRFA